MGIARLTSTTGEDDGFGSQGATCSDMVLESALMLSGETDSGFAPSSLVSPCPYNGKIRRLQQRLQTVTPHP